MSCEAKLKDFILDNKNSEFIKCINELRYSHKYGETAPINIDGTFITLWVAEQKLFDKFEVLMNSGFTIPRDPHVVEELWKTVKKNDFYEPNIPWIWTVLKIWKAWKIPIDDKLEELGPLVRTKVFAHLENDSFKDAWKTLLHQYLQRHPEERLTEYPRLHDLAFGYLKSPRMSICNIVDENPINIPVVALDIIRSKLLDKSYTLHSCELKNEIFLRIKDVISTSDWKELVRRLCLEHLSRFEFADLVILWITCSIKLAEISNFDATIKFFIDQGFAFAGELSNSEHATKNKHISNFIEYLETLDEKLDQEISTIPEQNAAPYVKRLDGFKKYLLHVYSDIRLFSDYANTVSPEIMDALYLYGISSAVVNEPFKDQAFTKTQKQLFAAIRRPTHLQQTYISLMDDAVRNAPLTTKPLWMWRGVGVPSISDINMNLDIFKSLSLSPTISLNYLREHKCCLLKVLVPPGVPLLPIDPFQQQKYEGGQFEFVLPRGAIFEFVKQYTIGERVVYECKVVYDREYEMELAPGRLRKAKRRASQMLTLEEKEANDIVQKIIRLVKPNSDNTEGINKIKFEILQRLQHYRAKRISQSKELSPEVLNEMFNLIKDTIMTRLGVSKFPNLYKELSEWQLDIQTMFKLSGKITFDTIW